MKFRQEVENVIHILIVDDHPAIGEGTRTMIEQEGDMTARVVTDSNQVLDIVKEQNYDLYLIDLYMPNINGIELSKMILQMETDAKILIYTGFDIDSHFNRLMEAGITGFLSKTATQEQLVTAIRCALREEAVIPLQLLKQLRRIEGKPKDGETLKSEYDIKLSEREQQILDGISRGLTNKLIAEELIMSQRTIEYHLTKIFDKLEVSSRAEAFIKANELGLLLGRLEKSEKM